jgi:hypothetical protein
VFITVVFTVASAGVWALLRWSSDIYLGTSFIVSEEALMWEFVLATVSGVVAGVIFDIYFERLSGGEYLK